MNINYKKAFPDSIVAEGNGKNFLKLQKLDTLVKRLDGQKVPYVIEYRWLSVECQNENDEAWACCQGVDFTYWSESELPINKIKDGTIQLFDVLSLF